MLVFAHRDLHAPAPENALEAFSATEPAGMGGIETGERLARDDPAFATG